MTREQPSEVDLGPAFVNPAGQFGRHGESLFGDAVEEFGAGEPQLTGQRRRAGSDGPHDERKAVDGLFVSVAGSEIGFGDHDTRVFGRPV